MQTNILWTGREYYSMENCLITRAHDHCEIRSAIIGMYDHKLYRVEYEIKTNAQWETRSVTLETQLLDQRQTVRYESDAKGIWTKDGNPVKELEGCVDTDISLTPFTNTLAINRLKLNIDESREITVLYIDILEQKVSRVKQKYTRLSPTEYRFENVPNNFGATITVDEEGLVVDYPELFERTYKCESNYQL